LSQRCAAPLSPRRAGRCGGQFLLYPTKEGKAILDDSGLIRFYTRAQALADGVLIDVSETAREPGIRYPGR
jgi:hypothetical protein